MKPELRPNNASAYFLFLSYAYIGALINKSAKKSILLQCENIVVTKSAICKIFPSEMQTVKFKEHKTIHKNIKTNIKKLLCHLEIFHINGNVSNTHKKHSTLQIQSSLSSLRFLNVWQFSKGFSFFLHQDTYFCLHAL